MSRPRILTMDLRKSNNWNRINFSLLWLFLLLSQRKSIPNIECSLKRDGAINDNTGSCDLLDTYRNPSDWCVFSNSFVLKSLNNTNSANKRSLEQNKTSGRETCHVIGTFKTSFSKLGLIVGR